MGQLLEETIATIVNLQQVHGQVYEDVVYAAKLWMKDICRKLTAHTHTLIFKWFDEQSYLFLDDHPKWQDMVGECEDSVKICEEHLEAWDRSTQGIIFHALTAALQKYRKFS